MHTRALNVIDAIQVLTYSWLGAIENLTSSGILTADELIQLMYRPLSYQDRNDILVDTVAYMLKNNNYNSLTVSDYVRIIHFDGFHVGIP